MTIKLLVELPVNNDAEVVSIRGEPRLEDRLNAMGIGTGQRLRKVSNVGMGGPVIVEVNRSRVAIGQGMARKIVVKRLDSEQGSKP